MKRVWIAVVATMLGLTVTGGSALAITPQQLKDALDQGDKMTTIDVRNRALYTEGHIPGAISVPVALVSKKRLPPLGYVVVYGDGVRTDLTINAVADLNAKRGIQAEMLEGGYSAWKAQSLSTTQKSGFASKRRRYLSYAEFNKVVAGNPDLVLVDLRSRGAAALTDLSAAYPGVTVISIRWRSQSAGGEWNIAPLVRSRRSASRHRTLYVLIGDGNEEAEKIATRLEGAGIKRVAILAGGEMILGRGGEKGLVTRDGARQRTAR